VTLKGITGGRTTTPDAHDGRLQKGKTKTVVKPTHHLTIGSFPHMGQEKSQTLIGHSGSGTHAT